MSKQAKQAAPNAPELFTTTAEILNGTLQYLAGRPYSEVFQLIEALKQSTPHEAAESKTVSPILEKS
jgi:hypothetical protein